MSSRDAKCWQGGRVAPRNPTADGEVGVERSAATYCCNFNDTAEQKDKLQSISGIVNEVRDSRAGHCCFMCHVTFDLQEGSISYIRCIPLGEVQPPNPVLNSPKVRAVEGR